MHALRRVSLLAAKAVALTLATHAEVLVRKVTDTLDALPDIIRNHRGKRTRHVTKARDCLLTKALEIIQKALAAHLLVRLLATLPNLRRDAIAIR